MNEPTVFQEGKFCGSCGWFELEDDEEDTGKCQSCGCPHSAHAAAKIVEA